MRQGLCGWAALGTLIAVAGLRADEPANLATQVRAAEKDIAAVRGLAFQSPVQTAAAAKDATVTYDPKTKVLTIPAGASRFDLLRGVARALTDQHFDLAKLIGDRPDSDEGLAHAALAEGDALLAALSALPEQEAARVGAPFRRPFVTEPDLKRAFRENQGLAHVERLKSRGGWKSVDGAYRFPPESTAAILHPDDPPFPIDLGSGTTVGELELIGMARAWPRPPAHPAEVAAGWCGGVRSGEPDTATITLAFTTAEQANRFATAFVQSTAADEPFTSDEPGVFLSRSPGRVLAIVQHGERVRLYRMPDEAALKSARDRQEGPPRVRIHSAADKKEITFGELTDRLLGADAVCVGEDHDNAVVHQVQLQVIKALFARDERLAVGMEMFQKPYQNALDRYTRGTLAEDEMLRQTEYRSRWGYPWQLYRPILRFCQHNSVPVAALNAPRELTRRLSQAGFEKLTDEEKRQLGPVDFQVKAHREHWYERLASMHGDKDVPADRKERSYQVMAAWDGVMAATAADFQRSRHIRRIVVLAGSGHIDRRFGIPDRLAKATGGTVATIHVAVGGKPEDAFKEPVTDFVILVE